jgi:hypothetical protein
MDGVSQEHTLQMRAMLMDMIIEHTVRTGHSLSVMTTDFGKPEQKTFVTCNFCNDIFWSTGMVIIDPALSTWVQRVREELSELDPVYALLQAQMFVLRRHAVEVEELTKKIMDGEIAPEEDGNT